MTIKPENIRLGSNRTTKEQIKSEVYKTLEKLYLNKWNTKNNQSKGK